MDFLNALSDEQRAMARSPFVRRPKAVAAHFKGGLRGDVDMAGERYGQAMWSNFPVSDVPRSGLRMGSLNEGQRQAVMALLHVLLSDRGYQKVLDIMGSDQALADSGAPYASGRAAYTIAVFRTPGIDRLGMVHGQALIEHDVSDFALAPGHDGETVQSVGSRPRR